MKTIPCVHCLGWYQKDDLWRHAPTCILNKESVGHPKTTVKKSALASGRLLKALPTETTSKFQEVLQGLVHDEVSILVKHDPLLLKFGERLTMKHGYDKAKHAIVRAKLRGLSCLIHEIRNLDKSVVWAADMMLPTMFSVIIQACRNLAGFDPHTGLFAKPSFALKLGTDLLHLIETEESLMRETGERSKREDVDDLKCLIKLRWSLEFTSNAHRTNVQRKMNFIKPVPLTQDVIKMQKYLKEEISETAYTGT